MLQRVYQALTTADQFSESTGALAEINPESSGKLSCFGSMITGFTLETIANKRLVQAWHLGNWDEGIYSIVKFGF